MFPLRFRIAGAAPRAGLYRRWLRSALNIMLGISYAALIVAQCFGDWRDGCGRVLVAVSLLQIMIITP